METIGDRVRRLRQAQGIARKDLARDAGMSYSGLSDLESGKAKTTTRLHHLSAALGVDVNYLETGKGSPSAETQASGHSQPVRLDPSIVRDVARALQEVYEDELGRAYSITDEPDLFVEMYERTVARGEVDSRSNMVWLGTRIGAAQQGAPLDERSTGIHGKGDVAGKARGRGSKA